MNSAAPWTSASVRASMDARDGVAAHAANARAVATRNTPLCTGLSSGNRRDRSRGITSTWLRCPHWSSADGLHLRFLRNECRLGRECALSELPSTRGIRWPYSADLKEVQPFSGRFPRQLPPDER